MKIPIHDFTRSFVAQARQLAPSPQVAQQLEALPDDSYRPAAPGLLGRLQSCFRSASPERLEAQSKQVLQLACQLLGPSLAGVVAQHVGRALVTPQQEVELAAGSPGQPVVGLQEVSKRVSAHARLPVQFECVEKGTFGPAMFLGNKVLLNRSEMQGMPSSVQVFLAAHELGHVEHRDSPAKIGLNTLAVLHPELSWDPNVASKEMEFAADRRAAEIAAREGCKPHDILLTLMSWPGGATHPDGLLRAAAVRQTMAEGGQSISDGEYQQLLEQAEPLRQQALERARQEAELKQAFQDLV